MRETAGKWWEHEGTDFQPLGKYVTWSLPETLTRSRCRNFGGSLSWWVAYVQIRTLVTSIYVTLWVLYCQRCTSRHSRS